MNSNLAWLALALVVLILVGITVAVVRKHRQRRTFSTSLRQDQIRFERRARIARQQRHRADQDQRRVH
jgi:hypothetical protein